MMLIVGIVMEIFVGVYLILLNGQIESRLHTAWNTAPEQIRRAIEHKVHQTDNAHNHLQLGCCGLTRVEDSPDCSINKSQACAALLIQTQSPIYTLLATICWVLIGISVFPR